jgi:predicted transcriptional regulator
VIEIRVQKNEKERRHELRRLLDQKDLFDATRTTILITPEQFQKLFSPERFKIIITLKERPISSISMLADRLGRPFEAVHRDVKLLESYGLVVLRKSKRCVIPTLAGRITVPICM